MNDLRAQEVVTCFAETFDLSKREFEVISLLVCGIKPKEIAYYFRCSEQAVYARLTRVCRKSQCGDYLEIVSKLFQLACQDCNDLSDRLRGRMDQSAPTAPTATRGRCFRGRHSDGSEGIRVIPINPKDVDGR